MKTAISKLLTTQHNVQFAYLFGSYAKGNAREESDVDIAVFLKNVSLDEKLSLHHALERALQKEIDLVVLNETKNIYLLESILKHGIVVKEDENRALFEVQKNHEIIDFKHFRRYIDAA